ncbi:MAG: hypothetical protein JXA67_22345, partial [Micromonosporaceae bacterium]|nr:hypothetical protein [Micromonosporaceae bacterium]
MTRAGRGAGQLARYGFSDVKRAAELLGTPAGPGRVGPSGHVALGIWDEVSARPVSEAAGHLLDAFGHAADPDLAVRQLCRLVAAAGPELLPALADDRRLCRRLIALLGVSSALGDWLVASPGAWRSLAGETPSWPQGYGEGETGSVPALRLAYRRALIRIVVADLTGAFDVETVMSRLSALADATLAAALAIAASERPQDAAACRLAVIAMGKCGGCELNYVSDVDVIFVAEPSPSGTAPDTAGATTPGTPPGHSEEQAAALRAA